MVDEANEIDQSNLTMKDMMVVSRDTGNALVPATAGYTDDNNTTHVGMLRFGDCDISEDNAKTSAQRENANLTFKTANLTHVSPGRCFHPCGPFAVCHCAVAYFYKMLSYRTETALQGTLVLAESGRLELRDNILLIL